MIETRRNLSKLGRGYAGMTQERWAEALGYSVRTVGAWESGEQPVSAEAAVRMADVSGAQVIAYWYLVDSLGSPGLIPDVEVTALPQAVLSLLRRLRDFGRRERVDELVAMAEDGKIGEDERPDFEAILGELDGIVRATLALRFAKEVKL